MPVLEIIINGKPIDLTKPPKLPWIKNRFLYHFIRPKWVHPAGKHSKVKIFTREEINEYILQKVIT
jgi:hypothetical protein